MKRQSQYLTGLSVPRLKVSCNMIPFRAYFVNRQIAQLFTKFRQFHRKPRPIIEGEEINPQLSQICDT